MMSNKIKVILIGAGNRGARYTDIMYDMPDKFEVVAVAEPIRSRRDYIKEKHGIPENMCFESWEQLLSLGKIADAAVVATMDRKHFGPAMAAINLKYNILLEKPIAPTAEECKSIYLAAEKNEVKILVGHVLRYAPGYIALKKLIDNGEIGDVVSIVHEEGVGNVHQTHSFVRGNWGNEQKSSFMLLQKSCHDMDILQWLVGKNCVKIQSFGALTHFTEKNAPQGTPDYCIDGCPKEDTCPYNAVKLYLDDKENDWFRTTCTKEADPTDEMVKKAISTTQYGKCVYKCDNNVVDHQTVNLLFEDDVTAVFMMSAFNKGGRYMHIMGTKGEIHANMDCDKPIEIYSFTTKETTFQTIEGIVGIGNIADGHGGGDTGIIEAFYDYLLDRYTGKSVCSVAETYHNHLIAFAAEQSRLLSTVVDFNEYVSTIVPAEQ